MNIGEKIKNLRTSKLMTQKELSGDEITRNMLSKIENGSAIPSLKTLIYLANRLGVPVGYLVADEETNEGFYKKYTNYPNIIKAYKSNEWEICRDLCLDCVSDCKDNDITYILAQSSLHLGASLFESGNLRAASKMFEDALEYSDKTAFDVGGIISAVGAYAEIISKISPSLILDSTALCCNSETRCCSDICKFADYLSKSGDNAKLPEEKDWKNPCYFYALNAKSLMKNRNFTAAIALLSHICEDDSLPRPIMYLVLDDYEKCCKETEDYKDAYEISQIKIQLFEKLLADI